MDWRIKGTVTPIKDHGQCGYYRAFSAVAAMEGITQLKTSKLISLSEQELVDCDTSGEDQGCEGGLMDNAFDFIQQNYGLLTETNYPYSGTDGTCNANKEANHAATITGHEDVPVNSESALLKAVANQPIIVAIDASGNDLQFYSSGVFTGQCGTKSDHRVTAVGLQNNANKHSCGGRPIWHCNAGVEGGIWEQQNLRYSRGSPQILDASLSPDKEPLPDYRTSDPKLLGAKCRILQSLPTRTPVDYRDRVPKAHTGFHPTSPMTTPIDYRRRSSVQEYPWRSLTTDTAFPVDVLQEGVLQ
ncbi:hypothetical protein AgCh_008975 [Apium graveolens]